MQKQLAGAGSLLAGAVLLLAAQSMAVSPPAVTLPTPAVLRQLLAGNSIEGEWAGRPYRQFFSPHGRTEYQQGTAARTRGTWRVNAQGQYCSVWPPSPRESCYTVRVPGREIYWQSGDAHYPSRVIDGKVFGD